MTRAAVAAVVAMAGLTAAPLATIPNTSSVRLLVVAPHPDDEVLAAGGLIARVAAAGGRVRIVYLTDGEGYPAGVEAEERVRRPSSTNYLEYGRMRQEEARAALSTLGVDAQNLTFLGFPNGGLHRLLTRYWSDRQSPYQSPYTKRNRPVPPDVVLPTLEFRGEDLTEELSLAIGLFRPTIIVAPRAEDQHVDHCAAWFFTADALTDVQRAEPAYHPSVLTYVVHYYSWMFEDSAPIVEPPADLEPARDRWRSVALTEAQVAAKRTALTRYDSQMKMMAWFLMGFVRHNEVFSVPRTTHIALPLQQDVCAAFEEPKAVTQ